MKITRKVRNKVRRLRASPGWSVFWGVMWAYGAVRAIEWSTTLISTLSAS